MVFLCEIDLQLMFQRRNKLVYISRHFSHVLLHPSLRGTSIVSRNDTCSNVSVEKDGLGGNHEIFHRWCRRWLGTSNSDPSRYSKESKHALYRTGETQIYGWIPVLNDIGKYLGGIQKHAIQ